MISLRIVKNLPLWRRKGKNKKKPLRKKKKRIKTLFMAMRLAAPPK